MVATPEQMLQNIEKLERMKDTMTREAKKWGAYLASLPNDEERAKELTRKFLEVALEARIDR